MVLLFFCILSVNGAGAQMLYIKLKPNVVTNHAHINEQFGFILNGKAKITIGNEKKICKSGDAYFIPSNVQHGFEVLKSECVEYIEVFCPSKEENM